MASTPAQNVFLSIFDCRNRAVCQEMPHADVDHADRERLLVIYCGLTEANDSDLGSPAAHRGIEGLEARLL